MPKFAIALLPIFISVLVLFTGCNENWGWSYKKQGADVRKNVKTTSVPALIHSGTPDGAEKTGNVQNAIDISVVKPNEDGKIMMVMFHNFVESFNASKQGNGAYTITFDAFGKLLQTLYDKNYRLINLNDYINNNISVKAGCTPIIFTFDDGTRGQFNLVEESGNLVSSRLSAVGIMEEFNKTHPDFGLKGTFFINLGKLVFPGKGSVHDRLKYLTDKGFEIGNHTLNHVNLSKITSADVIQKEIGGNQKKMYELLPGYEFNSFSLPYGLPAKELLGYVIKGEFEGTKYENLTIMKVGWDPAASPVSKKFSPLSTPRVRAPGIKPIEGDLTWWLNALTRSVQYISDGNPATVTIPENRKSDIDSSRLKNKRLIVY